MAQAALGMPENTARYGLAYGYGEIDVNDPNGDTQTGEVSQPLNLIYSDWLPVGGRFWLELQYLTSNLPASQTSIGQHVQQRNVTAVAQKNFRLARYFAPWLGFGIQLSQAEYSRRHTITDDGYLQQLYDDRETNFVSVVINSTTDWDISRHLAAGIKLEQSLTIGNNLNSNNISVIFLYQP